MTKFLILHGTSASPKANWFMWLKDNLIGAGHEVWLPQLPNADKPNAKTYTNFILANEDFVIDSNTILIGHSSGAVEILHLLQSLPTKTTVKSAILVSAFRDDLNWDALTGLFEQPFDFDEIKSHCSKFIFVHSNNDPYVPIEQAAYLAEQVGGEFMTFEGQGHFNTELSPSYRQFPQLLEIIKSVD